MPINKELDFKDYYVVLYKGKFLILFTLAAFLLPTWYFLERIPDEYDANSQLAMEDENQQNLFLTSSRETKNDLSYYSSIFNGRAFQEMLFNTLDTSKIPGQTSIEKKEFLVASFRLLAGTHKSFLKINARTNSPELSFALVQKATDSLIVFCRNVENQESERAFSAIQKHIEETANNYDATLKMKDSLSKDDTQGDIHSLAALETAYEKQLVEFELKNADLAAKESFNKALDNKVNTKAPVSSSKRKNLNAKLEKLRMEMLKREQLGLPSDSLTSKIEDLKTQIQKLSQERSVSLRDINLVNQWKASRKELSEAKADLSYTKIRLGAFRKKINSFKNDHPNITRYQLEMYRLDGKMQRYTNTHKRLTEKIEDEIIKMQAQSGGLKLVDPPFLHPEPVEKNMKIFFVIASLVGFIVGIGTAILREFMDDTIKTPDDIEKHLGLPLLGTIPHIVTRKSDLLIRRSTTKKRGSDQSFRYPELILRGDLDEGFIAEAYRSFRTNILFASPDLPLQSFLISSCGPHEGKSLTAANVALSFAQQGDPTILIDTDLRRPICHHLFHLDRGPGFGDLFSGDCKMDDVITTIKDSSLKIITAGTFLPNPAELLGSNKFASFLKELKSRFKYIIFDTPPIIAVTDACILSTKLDGAVILVRAEHTSLQVAQRSLQALSKVNANILGCLLNDVNLSNNKGYYGYYKNYYQYYHTSKD